jgi:hypothetical protein
MAKLRIAGVLVGLMLLTGCMGARPAQDNVADNVTLSGPCAPNYVSLALSF